MATDGPSDNNHDNSNGNNNWDIESARRHLEDLIGSGGVGDDMSAVRDKVLPDIKTIRTHPPLTAIARVRRTAEIQLLSQLENSVEAADALNDLWLHERGSRAASLLKNADSLFQQGESSWNKAEDMFLNLIRDYGPHWVEPLHRLAMLYYLQGRLDEARQLEETVLKLKPWHIGSLSNFVRISESQKDTPSALRWAARRLPPRLGKRRREWVQREVQRAMNFLSRGESRLRTFMGDAAVDEPWQ